MLQKRHDNMWKLMICTLGIVCTICVSCSTEIRPRNPNIIIIFTDDQGYGDVGCFGATGFATPNLDKLAADGLRLTHFYSVQAVCSASRAGLLTGCYPNRIGITGALMPDARIGINGQETTLAEIARQSGYRTAIFGKWHLGHHAEFLPLQHGFDEYLGIPYSNDMWPVDYDGTPVSPESPLARKLKHPPLPLVEGNVVVDTIETLEDQGTLTTLYTAKAVDFINRCGQDPFFLYLPHSMPHVPLGVSEKFQGKSAQGMYGDVMMEIDWSVGEILRTLEQHHLTRNTLVIFISDNGPWLNYGNHAGSTGGLREGKGTSFEGGQRVPCIMKWPEVIAAGSICNKMAATIDILPTMASILGAGVPPRKIDGVNILPLLEGDEDANPRRELLYYYGKNNLEAIRSDQWKLIFPHTYRTYEGTLPANDGWPGPYVFGQLDTLELYNLRRDPGERYNVAEMYPETVQRLNALAEAARRDLGDDLTGITGTGSRDPGRVE